MPFLEQNQISGKDFSVISFPFHEIKNKDLQGYMLSIVKGDKVYIMLKFKGMIIALDKKVTKGNVSLHVNLDHLFMLSVQENFIIK